MTLTELRDIVAANEKQRFSLVHATELPGASETLSTEPPDQSSDNVTDEASQYFIRANQGHSIRVGPDELLVAISETNLPETVVHGTTFQAWKGILKSGGLKPMGRNHVHFASGLPPNFGQSVGEGSEAKWPPVISGIRNSSSILIYIDLPKALEEGYNFWLSENGVILADGGESGLVPTTLFKQVVDCRKEVVVMRDGEIADGMS